MGITNITFIFDQIPPCERKKGEKRWKETKILHKKLSLKNLYKLFLNYGAESSFFVAFLFFFI